MNEYQYWPSQYQVERSLLQKAVRRGDTDVTEKVVMYLLGEGDVNWLRDRLFVIAYEECWPIANQIQTADLVTEYVKIASSIKNKNAWGLAMLAKKYNDGVYKLDWEGSGGLNAAIMFIAKTLKEPDGFWEELQAHDGYASVANRVLSARNALNRAKFPDDKAMMYAAGYLSVFEKVPQVGQAQQNSPSSFPYWVAFDRHTDEGKKILERIAEKLGVETYKIMRLTFYKAGVVCNQITDSPYYECFMDWQNAQMKDVAGFWRQISVMIIEQTKDDVDKLIKRISNPKQKSDNEQLPLF